MSRTALAGVGVAAGIAVIASHLTSGSVAYAAATDLVATGAGQGGGPHVRTFGPDGKDGGVSYYANGTGNSGTNVAVGDVTGDGAPEIITGTGPGIEARIQIWARDGKTLVAETKPFPGFNGGVNVAVANVDESAALEVLVAAGPGGGPHVKALRLLSGLLTEVFGFYAYDPGFTGGVYLAGAPSRIITGAGAGGGPHVRVFHMEGGAPALEKEWMAYGSFNGGVRVAAGAVRADNVIDVVTAAGPGGGPHVILWSLAGQEGPGFFAYDPTFRGGAFVAVANGKRLITGAGAGGGPHVKILTFANEGFSTKAGFYAYAPEFSGGVRVAGFPLTVTAPAATTTTAGCDGTELPGVGCVPIGGSGGETTTTAAPATTTTTRPATTTTSTTAPATTTTTIAGGTTTTTVPPTTTTTAASCLLVPPIC